MGFSQWSNKNGKLLFQQKRTGHVERGNWKTEAGVDPDHSVRFGRSGENENRPTPPRPQTPNWPHGFVRSFLYHAGIKDYMQSAMCNAGGFV